MLEPFDEADIWTPQSNLRSSRLLGSAFLIFAGLGSLAILVFVFSH